MRMVEAHCAMVPFSHMSYPDAIETECHTFTDYGFVGLLDGVTVAKSIVLKDKFENLGAR
jgi:hypothetical protein